MQSRFGPSVFANVQSPRNNGALAITPAQNPPIVGSQMQGGSVQLDALTGEVHRYALLKRGRASIDGAGSATYNPTQAVLNASSSLRNFLFLKNTSATISIAIGFGQQPNVTEAEWILGPLGFMGFDVVVPQDDIFAQSMTASPSPATLVWNVSYIQVEAPKAQS